MKKAMVDLRCINLCRLLRWSPLRDSELGATISAMAGSVRSVPMVDWRRTPPWWAASFGFAGRPIQGLLHGLALEVANGHLGGDALVVHLLGDLVRRRRTGDRQGL